LSIREFFVDWLTASRYVKWLESRYHEQKQVYTQWLGEKDAQIKQLRLELLSAKADGDRMRAVLMPYASPLGAVYSQQQNTSKPPVVPTFSGPDDWQSELNKLYEQEKQDGISSERRQEVHESSSNDAA
jgi:hypothetical protein